MIPRRKFVKTAAGVLVPATCLGSVPIPFGFFKPASASGISPAALAALNDWVSRVQGQSSDVTIAGTQTAVGQFIDGLMTDGVWSKIVRMSIYAGDGLNALKAPLKNGGPSATDNVFNFVSGNYSQSTGLQGGSSKFIGTGLNWNSGLMGDTDFHVSVYYRTKPGAGTHTCAYCSSGGAVCGGLTVGNDPSNSYFFLNDSVSVIAAADSNGTGHYIGTRTSSSSAVLYRAGSSLGSSSSAGGSRPVGQLFLHCLNFNGSPDYYTGATLELYSIGTGLTATDAANFTSRYATLRAALGR